METGAGDGAGSVQAEARRLLRIAEKLLHAGDLVGGKRFAERALDSNPLADGVDQILAVVDVLLASHRRVNNQPDWYSILHLPHPSHSSSAAGDDDTLNIKRSYRRLALLLSPDRNKLPFAHSAYRFVIDAFSFLSDPSKKSLFDSQLRSNTPVGPPMGPPFWTWCPSCFHVFEYDRSYINRTLRCRTCMRPFHAGEMAAPPPIVPETDMYYCAWGFFPLGFPGGGFPNLDAAGVPEFGHAWKPFYPVSPCWGNQAEGHAVMPLNAVPVNVAPGNPNVTTATNHCVDSIGGGKMEGFKVPSKRFLLAGGRKVVEKKRAGNYAKKVAFFGETDSGTERLEARGVQGAAEGCSGIPDFDIDLDATENLLSNLNDLPFL